MMIQIDNHNKFDKSKFEDAHSIDVDEQIFNDEPIYTFQAFCLENVLLLCGWNKRNLSHILNVSDSTVNNILANESMTNTKPTYLTRCQFITLLHVIQIKKVKEEQKALIVFYLFSYLCSGLGTEHDMQKIENLFPLEGDQDIGIDLFFELINKKFPDLFKQFNLFIEWRISAPEKSMSEYYGGDKNQDGLESWFFNQPKDTECIKKAIQNKDKFIPLYLDWYVSQFSKWE